MTLEQCCIDGYQLTTSIEEQQLEERISNAGGVVRVGPHVLRPSGPQAESIHAFLSFVRLKP